jgi:hypothetical protein
MAKTAKQSDCEAVLASEDGPEICEALELASAEPVTRIRQSADQGFPLVTRSLDPRSAPTGLGGATPGLASIIRANTIPATPARRDPPRPAPRRSVPADPPFSYRTPPKPICPSQRPERVQRSADEMSAGEQDVLARRGLSTSRALADLPHPQGLVTRSAQTNQRSGTMKPKIKRLRAGPQDIVARQIQINPADEPRWVETLGSIIYRTTLGALPRPQPVRRSKAARQPAIETYARGVDSNGREKRFQSLRNLVRRSVGLPR